MSRPLKAIETHYAGCRFRSRLEARWAVFFDALGISWEYEPEGFELPSGRYLPDFRTLPRKSTPMLWIEVKPFLDDGIDRRWKDLVRYARTPLGVLYGMHRDGDNCNSQHGYRGLDFHKGMVRTKSFPGGIFGGLSPKTAEAYAAASSARFEHGESGAPVPQEPRRTAAPAVKPSPKFASADDVRCSRERTGNPFCPCSRCVRERQSQPVKPCGNPFCSLDLCPTHGRRNRT